MCNFWPNLLKGVLIPPFMEELELPLNLQILSLSGVWI